LSKDTAITGEGQELFGLVSVKDEAAPKLSAQSQHWFGLAIRYKLA
jgi:hypothetical protein